MTGAHAARSCAAVPRRENAMKIFAFLVAAIVSASTAVAQSTAFTFQGSLKDNGQPAAGLHDFRFKLYDAASAGTQIGTTQCVDNLQVAEGRFTATLDFGNQFTTPNQRYIEIEVRRDTGLNCSNAGGFVVLSPRQLITAAPRATDAKHANSAFTLDSANGAIANAVFVDNNGNVGIGTTTPTERLTIAAPAPGIDIQDTDSSTGQVGYISFRDIANTLRGWLGYGTAGDPDFSIINARAGGDIVLNTLGGGKVGIGTASPGAALDVRGDIRMGTTGQQFAARGEENLRVIRGAIDWNGTVLQGSGFACEWVETGKYRITFTTTFAGTPTVNATSFRPANPLNGVKAVMLDSVNASSVVVVIRAQNGDWGNETFHFTAIGPR